MNKPTYSLAITLSLTALVGLTLQPIQAQQNPAGLALSDTAQVRDTFMPLAPAEVMLRGGLLGTRVEKNARVRLLNVDENDLLDAFERRNAPHQDWQGEHVGKFLHAATLAWANTGDPQLKAKLDRVVLRLLKTQEPDGYLGTYVGSHRWTSWDVWVHKYDLLGLLTYYQFTHQGSEGKRERGAEEAQSVAAKPGEVLAACRKIGDLLIRTFGSAPGQRDINKAGEHVGLAPDSVLEAVVLLYRATRDERYLQFATYIKNHYDAPGGPAVLASLEKYGSVRRVANGKAYEMTSNFNGLLELYRATGDKRLLRDMETAWQDIVTNRLYLTGSASSYEVFQDDFHLPNAQRFNICETCVTVTWEQMNLELLRLTGEAKYADEIERSVYNHLLGAQKPTGDDWAYYTPLEGRKPYDAATTCCHSSGPRGVALVPTLAYMTSRDGGLVVNLYNSGTATVKLPSGKLTLTQETAFPFADDPTLNVSTVNLTVTPARDSAKFLLHLRLPAWSDGFSYAINGQPQALNYKIGSAQYLTMDRVWQKGDRVTLTLNTPTRLVLGDHENAGKIAIMHGPLVLAADSALNPDIANFKRLELATDKASAFGLTLAPKRARSGEIVYRTDGRVLGKPGTVPLYLTPYATAGQDGKSHYAVWINRPGMAQSVTSGSKFSGDRMTVSRTGNESGDIADDDPNTFAVTFNGTKADRDWFAITHETPITISKVVFAHGKTFHDGGWFDTSAGTDLPEIQVQTERNGAWKTVAVLAAYPKTTATDAAGLKDGQLFSASFPPVKAIAVRVLGKPATGDTPTQAFSSCGEIQGF